MAFTTECPWELGPVSKWRKMDPVAEEWNSDADKIQTSNNPTEGTGAGIAVPSRPTMRRSMGLNYTHSTLPFISQSRVWAALGEAV